MRALYVTTLSIHTEKYENYQENEHPFLGRMLQNTKKSKISRKHRLQFLRRISQRQKLQKNPNLIVKTRSRVLEITEKYKDFTKNKYRSSWKAEKVRNFTDKTRFRPFQKHHKHTKSTRITTKHKYRRTCRAGNYANLQTKPVRVGAASPETTKIHRWNEHASRKPKK